MIPSCVPELILARRRVSISAIVVLAVALLVPAVCSGQDAARVDGNDSRRWIRRGLNATKLLHADNARSNTSHFEIIEIDWENVQAPLIICIWLLVVSLAKILFHVNRRFGESIPDSALLIVVGLVVGMALKYYGVSENLYTLNSTTFFIYLLPPIMFDAGYFMPSRQLFDNLDSVALFALVGTVWNTAAIGATLVALSRWRNPFSVAFTPFEVLQFAALISAVDPVAVITVFEEIGINEFLFINVFGEALFNDGITVVLYRMLGKFSQIAVGQGSLAAGDYVAGVASFVVIALGGVTIGVVFALLVSLITRYTGRVKPVAPVFIFTLPYVAYLMAEMLGVSAILAVVTCGIGMRQYVEGNISHNASSSVKYFVKILSQCSETVIFMFLGLSTVSCQHHVDAAFLATTVVACLVYRTLGVLAQCALLNRFRVKQFSAVDQFVLSYGGLRGAIAYGLVVSLRADIAAKPMFITTTIAVIYVTVFLQGCTIRPLLGWLKVERHKARQEKMIECVYSCYADYTMAGIEGVVGVTGKHSVRDAFERFNAKVLKPLLVKNVRRRKFDATTIIRAFAKMTMADAVGRVQSLKLPDSSEKLGGEWRHRRVHSVDARRGPTPKTITAPSSNGVDYAYGTFPTQQRHVIRSALQQEESAQTMYEMLSKMLDKKIEELLRASSSPRRRRGTEGHSPDGLRRRSISHPGGRYPLGEAQDGDDDDDDIKDDYIDELHCEPSDDAEDHRDGGVHGASRRMPQPHRSARDLLRLAGKPTANGNGGVAWS